MLLDEVKRYIPERLPVVYQLLRSQGHNKKVVVFKSREEAEAWLAEIRARRAVPQSG